MRNLPHARELELIWDNGESWKLRLDQGVGYWRTAPYVHCEFPFEKSVEKQIERLEKVNVLIEPISKTHPTYWYCEG